MVSYGFQKVFKTKKGTNNMEDSEAELISEAKIISVSIDKLKLDSNNVRLKHLKKTPDETTIEAILREVGNTSELANQILADNVVYEPLVIDSNYVVIEGNRRLVALRTLIRDIESGKINADGTKLNKVKCRMLPKQVSQKSIDIYLAAIHVRSKKPWKLFNRSKHIYQLSKVHHLSYNEIATRCGMAKNTIQRAIVCYQLVLDFSRKYPNDKEWFTKYSYFEELFKRKDLKDFRDNPNNVTKFSLWIYNGKFHDYQDLRKLNLVMMDGDAFKEFEKNGFRSALLILEKNDPSISNIGFQKIKDTTENLKDISRSELIDIKSSPAKMRMLYNLESEIKSLISELEATKPEKKQT